MQMEPILDHKLALDSLHSTSPNSIGCHHLPPYIILGLVLGGSHFSLKIRYSSYVRSSLKLCFKNCFDFKKKSSLRELARVSNKI